MRTSTGTQQAPQTLEEFMVWEPNDGYKYEWNDGEVVRFESIKKRHFLVLRTLSRSFARTKAYQQGGELIYEQDVWLTRIQLRRPDLAFFSGE